jgi:hypothetical protein
MTAKEDGAPPVAFVDLTERVATRYHAFVAATRQTRHRLDIVSRTVH